ncbi:hypothetical protein [Streptomyces sp. UNOC14_S4]|uniref:hypothetical protein n=1 Tax=Streptomyces sp. UNOC14_S4 TaxID=2872340 RepID=UPI001E5D3848|nr:hypothetical protein [Streptomyces sp. UNOC14_S4]MCC3767897.1 hypothetical protein [Streptomyces sp. UNOC14_S4]
MDQRHPLSSSASAIVWLALCVAAVAGAVWTFVVGVPDQMAEERAFRSAAVCAEPPAEARTDCRWDRDFVISGIRTGSKRNEAVLTDAVTGARHTRVFHADGPLLGKLRDGESVTGTVWGGAVVEIAARGATQATVMKPTEGSTSSTLLGGGIGLGAGGLLAGSVLVRRLRQGADKREPTKPMSYVLRLAVGLGLSGVVASLAADALHAGLWPVPVIWAALATVLTALTVWAVRRHAARTAPVARTGTYRMTTGHAHASSTASSSR